MVAAAPAATAGRILDVAERLVQTRGYNGFSYADISAQLRIRNASVHYHFPTKTDLGKRLVSRYRQGFRRRRASPDVRSSPARAAMKPWR